MLLVLEFLILKSLPIIAIVMAIVLASKHNAWKDRLTIVVLILLLGGAILELVDTSIVIGEGLLAFGFVFAPFVAKRFSLAHMMSFRVISYGLALVMSLGFLWALGAMLVGRGL